TGLLACGVALSNLDGSHTCRGLACVPTRLLFLVRRGHMLALALADRRHWHLHDVSPPFDASQLHLMAEVVGVSPDRAWHNGFGRGRDRLGRRPPPAPC